MSKNNKEKSSMQGNVTLRSLIWGTIVSGLFAFITVYFENRQNMNLTPNQLPMLPYLLLVLFVMLINPVLRLIRLIKPLSLPEMMVIFAMCLVSSGISTFGLTSQLLPIISGISNRHWNNSQTEWNRYIEPYLNENFFISEPGTRKAAMEYAVAAREYSDYKAKLPSPEEKEAWTEECERLNSIASQKRETLSKLEEKAFQKVELFRRGLADDKRAFPGIFYTTDDTASSYFRRIGRFTAGRKAADILRNIAKSANPQADLAAASQTLAPYFDDTDPKTHIEAFNTLVNSHSTEIQSIDEQLIKLNTEKRVAQLDDLHRMEEEIDRLESKRVKLTKKIRFIEKKREKFYNEQIICGRVKEICERLDKCSKIDDRDLIAKDTEAILCDFPAIDATIARFFVGDVPWSHWLKPIFWWGIIIILTYIVLYTFNILIFRQWAYNEKLIFPLIELSETLVGFEQGQESHDRIPPLFKSGLFWIGFAIAAGVMGWNLLCKSEIVPGLVELDLNNSWTPFIRTSMFKGLCYGARSPVFFTMIGLAFLIPQKVSFSMWFFHIFYMVLLLLLVAFGFGVNENSFPSEWWYTMNFKSAIGGGGMIVFASLVLWKCRNVLFCALCPKRLENVTANESRELRVSSIVFLLSSLMLVIGLWLLLDVNIFYAIFGYVMIIIITIGFMRAVAEGGILSFHLNASPFHIIRNVLGMDKGFTAAPLYASFMLFYSILFLDLKAFIAPSMTNGLKVCDDMKMSRRRYHIGIFLGMAVAIIVSILLALMFCYDSGANAMSTWFYTQFPLSTFKLVGNITKMPPTAMPGLRNWLILGAILMAVLLYFRQNNFWLPHPIGLIMLANPLMSGYWFSLLLGWLAKALVTKYANKETYGKVRGLFIGLILGEFFIVVLAMIFSCIMENKFNISLNRM